MTLDKDLDNILGQEHPQSFLKDFSDREKRKKALLLLEHRKQVEDYLRDRSLPKSGEEASERIKEDFICPEFGNSALSACRKCDGKNTICTVYRSYLNVHNKNSY